MLLHWPLVRLRGKGGGEWEGAQGWWLGAPAYMDAHQPPLETAAGATTSVNGSSLDQPPLERWLELSAHLSGPTAFANSGSSALPPLATTVGPNRHFRHRL
jgi:hypothetical protein